MAHSKVIDDTDGRSPLARAARADRTGAFLLRELDGKDGSLLEVKLTDTAALCLLAQLLEEACAMCLDVAQSGPETEVRYRTYTSFRIYRDEGYMGLGEDGVQPVMYDELPSLAEAASCGHVRQKTAQAAVSAMRAADMPSIAGLDGWEGADVAVYVLFGPDGALDGDMTDAERELWEAVGFLREAFKLWKGLIGDARWEPASGATGLAGLADKIGLAPALDALAAGVPAQDILAPDLS